MVGMVACGTRNVVFNGFRMKSFYWLLVANIQIKDAAFG